MARAHRWSLVGVVGLVLAGCTAASADTSPTVGPSETAPVNVRVAATTAAPQVSEASTTLLTPSTTAAPTTTTTIPAPCTVIAVADSVGIDLFNNGLKDQMASFGCTLKWTGGQRGMEFSAGADVLAGAGDIDADIVVVMVGYHNAKSNTQAGRFPSLIDKVMEAAGPRLVIWPTMAATDDCSANYKTAVGVANGNLDDALARWPNLRLVDYNSLLAAHPEYSVQRCPHLLASGSKAVAGWLAGQVREAADAALAAASGN